MPSFAAFPTLFLRASRPTLGKSLGCLASALAGAANGLVGSLADLADCLAGAFADLASGLPGALANVLNRSSGAFASVLDRLTALTDEMTSALAYLLSRTPDPFQQLGVAVERRQHSLEDQGDVA